MKFPEFVPGAFTTANNAIILLDRKMAERLAILAYHVSATLHLLREVNKFLLAHARNIV